jgi:RHS repeat-associated protein
LPTGVQCITWEFGDASGWVDTSTAGTIVWDQDGMYGISAAPAGTVEFSVAYDLGNAGPWLVSFEHNQAGQYRLFQGEAMPTSGQLLSDNLFPLYPDTYFVTARYIQLRWSVVAPVDPLTSLRFGLSCYGETAIANPDNRAPLMDAGPDRVVAIDASGSAALVVEDGTGWDDCFPRGILNVTWEVVSQPEGSGEVVFITRDIVNPRIIFPAVGVYVLRLVGTDTVLSHQDELSVQVIEPADLVVAGVDDTGLNFNSVDLSVSGSMSVDIRNLGTGLVYEPFKVSIFEDRNYSGAYELGFDVLLGSSERSALGAGDQASISIPLSGDIQFPGSPLYAWVDSENDVIEVNETNNIGASADRCFIRPAGVFSPTLEWSWTGSPVLPESSQVLTTPLVADLNQDNQPEVIFMSYSGQDFLTQGVLRVVQGNTGNEVLSLDDPAYRLRASSTMAIGNIDVDNELEIVALGASGRHILAFEHDGTLKWQSPELNFLGSAGLVLAELNGQTLPEIIAGASVLSADGAILWQGTGGRGDNLDDPLSIVANINLQGPAELIAGNTAYSADGSILWQRSDLPDGYNAVGNFDADPEAEIVLVAFGKVYVLDHQGQTLAGPWNIPGGGRGGAPTLADFDSDGVLEIGVAGARRYAVWEADGNLKWQTPIQDLSSNVAAATAFDFEADGLMEVVFRDETTLYVWRGIDGTRLWANALPSLTASELPIVADADQDGRAELLVSSTLGLRVFGANTWASTRAIWNQHSYHITNIDSGGAIPLEESPSWTSGAGGYRQNLVALPCNGGLADANISFVRAVAASDGIRILARIGNAGNSILPAGIGVNFYNGDPSGGLILGANVSQIPLAPGQFEDVFLRVPRETVALPLVLMVDEENRVNELNETNNRLDSTVYLSTDLAVDSLDISQVSVDPRTLQREGQVTTTISNLSFAPIVRPFDVVFFGDDGDGEFSAATDFVLHRQTVPSLGAGQSQVLTASLKDEARFWGDIIYVVADANAVLLELDRENNLRHSAEALSLPDLTVSRVRRIPNSNPLALNLRIGNGGNLTIPAGAKVTLYSGDPGQAGAQALATLNSTPSLTRGQYVDLRWEAGTTIALPLWVSVDDDGTLQGEIQEAREDNNLLRTRIYLSDTPNEAPVVDAGEDRPVLPEVLVLLGGSVEDDGLPINQLSIQWEVLEAPEGATVTFTDTSDPATGARFDTEGVYVLRLFATDDEYDTEDTVELLVEEADAPEGLLLEQPGCIAEPAHRSTVSGLVPINVAAGTNLREVVVDYWKSGDTTQVTRIAEDFNISNGGLATHFDSTLVRNDSYVLRVRGYDEAQGAWRACAVFVTVTGENKPGRVTLSATDIVIPVVGLPIAVGRTYDSLNRNQVGDFGNGWNLDITSVDLEVDEAENVTLTMPDGQRTTFYFSPYPPSAFNFYQLLLIPNYISEPGYYGELKTDLVPIFAIHGPQGSRWNVFPGNQFYPTRFYFTDPYGRKFTIERGWDGTEGKITKIEDLNGNVITFTSNGIQSSNGLNVSIQRDAEGRITSITDTEGQVYTYLYDAAGNLAEVDLPGVDTNIRYSYTPDKLFTEGLDARGNRAVLSTYYPDGRLQTVTDALNQTTSYSYDIAGNSTTITYPDGGIETTVYNQVGKVLQRTDPLGRVTTYSYDANKNLLTETNDLGETITYTYNDKGRRTSVTDALGNTIITATYNTYSLPTTLTDALGQSRTIDYDPFTYMPVGASDSLGTLGTYTWDSKGSPLTRTDGAGGTYSFTYDAYGNVLTQTDPLGRTTSFTYDTFGRRLSQTDALGRTTTFIYDPLGRLLSSTDALGQTSTYAYDGNGNRVSMTDALGQTTSYEYDANNNLTRIIHPDGAFMQRAYDFRGNVTLEIDETGIKTRYAYDSAGQLLVVTTAADTPEAVTTRYAYDDAGRIASMTVGVDTPEASTTTYSYDAAGRLSEVRNALNQSTRFEYDALGQLTLTRDPLGRETRYTYNARGQNTQITYPDATSSTMAYDGAGRMISSTNALGETVSYTYDLAGQRRSVSNPLGQTSTYTYDAVGRLLSMDDPLGRTMSYVYDEIGRLRSTSNELNETSLYTYDAIGRVTQFTDPLGAVTSYGYDSRNRQTSVTYPTLPTESPAIASMSYDAAGRMLTQTDPNGNQNCYAYDAAGRTASMTWGCNSLQAATQIYDYTSRGERALSTDPNGNTTRYFYDAVGRMVEVRDSLGQSQFYAYDAAGQLTSITDAGGRVTTFAYNNRGWQTGVTYPDNSSTSTSYDAVGRSLSSTDPLGQITRYDYDSAGRMLSLTVADGTPDEATSSYTYDAAGQLLTMTDPNNHSSSYLYDGAGRQIRYTDPLGAQTHYAYDSAGRLTSIRDANNHTTAYSYHPRGWQIGTLNPDGTTNAALFDPAGRQIAYTDENGHTTGYAYDALDRLTGVTNPLNESTVYTYDAAGNITTLQDAAGKQTRFAYDALNRQTRKTWADTTYETYTYDAVGNLTAHRLADGQINNFYYDQMNRLVEENYYDGITVEYTYLANGLRRFVDDDRGRSTYAYDFQDRPARITQPDGQAVDYDYDPAGNLLRMETPAAEIFYTYDAANRPLSVDGGGGASTMTYDPVGNLTGILYPNGISSDYDYDSRNRLTYLGHRGAGLIEDYAYTLDGVGNRISVQEGDGTSIDWLYDPADRLTRENRYNAANSLTSSTVYTYDPAGNRLTHTTDGILTSYTYDVVDQLISTTTAGVTTTYTYDPRGNLITEASPTETTTYAWNGRNQLSAVTLPDTTVISYDYDYDGRRVSQTAAGVETNYLWDETSPYGDVVLEYDQNENPLAEYTLAGGALIAQERGGDESYYLKDGQGSTRHLTDSTGTTLNTYDYTAYGELYESTGSSPNSYLYTGQQYDALTGDYYLRARYYDPGMGRFASRDTWAYNYRNPVELNRYGYTANNPVNRWDPSGYSLVSFGSLLHENITTARVLAATVSGMTTGLLGSGLSYMLASIGFCGDEGRDWAAVTDYRKYVALSASIGGLSGAALSVINVGAVASIIGTASVSGSLAVTNSASGQALNQLFDGCTLVNMLATAVQGIIRLNNGNWPKTISITGSVGIVAGVQAAGAGAWGGAQAGIEVAKTSATVGIGAGNIAGAASGILPGLAGGIIGIIGGALLSVDLCLHGKGDWKLGDVIDMCTPGGDYPEGENGWKKVSRRYWKNRELNARGTNEFSNSNMKRMANGQPPCMLIEVIQTQAGQMISHTVAMPIELHHLLGRNNMYYPDGNTQNGYIHWLRRPHRIENLREMTPWDHARLDPTRYKNWTYTRTMQNVSQYVEQADIPCRNFIP